MLVNVTAYESYASDPMAVTCFMEEIALLKRLSAHKEIVTMVDSSVDEEEGCINVVMEAGEIDLFKLLRKHEGGLPENYLRLYWQQMLEAVHTVHEEKIIHSDLKPANFLCVQGPRIPNACPVNGSDPCCRHPQADRLRNRSHHTERRYVSHV